MQVLSGIGRALFTVLSMFWEILWPLILGLTLSGIVQVMVLHWTLARTLGCEVARKDDAIFFGDDGKPLAYWGAAALFRCLKKKTGIDGKRVSAHNCRRYMATTQLADGRSPLDVQRQMGHRNLTMTNKYASLTVQHLKKSHE